MRTLKPGKQRKMLYQAPDHKRHKLFAAHLSPELQASQKVKTLPVRTGDTVHVMRGDHKGFEGKVSRIDSGKYRIYIEGLTREKVDGTTISVPVHPSKVVIKNLNLDDKWRKKIIERKQVAQKQAKIAEKPVKGAVEIREEITEKRVKSEGLKEKKPKGRKRRTRRKPKAEKTKEKAVAKVEEKPKEKKTRKKRRSTKKTEGGT